MKKGKLKKVCKVRVEDPVLNQTSITMEEDDEADLWLKGCLGFTQKLRAEDNILRVVFFTNRFCKSNRDCGFDDHDRLRIDGKYELDDILHKRGIEIVQLPAGEWKDNSLPVPALKAVLC